ncbi:MAG: response regulator [Patescibacteria group bacterium]
MNKKRVWVIDDDDGILDVVSVLLESEGFEPVVINNPASVNKRVQTEQLPDLVILDILMSGVDGRDVAKLLKTGDDTKNIPIIMMSADMRAEEKAREAMADDCIRKPFDIDDLLKKVYKQLEKGEGNVQKHKNSHA